MSFFFAAVHIARNITSESATSFPSSVITGTDFAFSSSRWEMVFPSKSFVMLTLWITSAKPKSAAFLSFASAASCEEITGFVLGIRTRSPYPPAAAAFEPVSMSSFCVSPGSLKCACISIKDGMSVRPRALKDETLGSLRSICTFVFEGKPAILFFSIRTAEFFISIFLSTRRAL